VIIVVGLVVLLGALVQGAVGYGMSLIAAPLLVLVDPALVPVPLLLLTTVHATLAVVRDWRPQTGPISAGRCWAGCPVPESACSSSWRCPSGCSRW
jgi:uncharacterized membrane protein YfcA